MQYKTIVLAVLSALALSACGSGGGGIDLSVSNKDSASNKGSESLDVSDSLSQSRGESAKTSASFNEIQLVGLGARPAIAANGINLNNRAAYFLYEGGDVSLHMERLAKLNLAAERQAGSTPQQVELAMQELTTIKEGDGFTNALNQVKRECLETVIAGDAAQGRVCLKDYYQVVYFIAGGMALTWSQTSPEFSSEVNQKFSSERSFPVNELETNATSVRMIVNIASVLFGKASAEIPPNAAIDANTGALDAAFSQMVKNIQAIPQEERAALLTRPTRPQKLNVDFKIEKGEANSGLTYHFLDTGLVVKADVNGLTALLNGTTYLGGEHGVVNGMTRNYTIEATAGRMAELRSNLTNNTSTESSSSQETSSGFKL